MGSSDDDDDRRVPLGQTFHVDPSREVSNVLDELEDLLKNGDVIEALSNKGINASLALVAIDGLRAYLDGRKADAADDLGTVAEEIRGRLELTRSDYKETN
ncbi:MAG TPA: hypothetical protein PKA58_22350 [Polyangium sp.]|nr:hypothetical protein [Polyangium sp.]